MVSNVTNRFFIAPTIAHEFVEIADEVIPAIVPAVWQGSARHLTHSDQNRNDRRRMS
jgi:hypothetical protein